MRRLRANVLWATLFFAAVACSSSRNATSSAVPTIPPRTTGAVVATDQRLDAICNRRADDVLTAWFPFDVAELSDESVAMVDAIASCFATGRIPPDTKIAVTGYTDAMGPESYNRELGLYRAIAVKEALVDRGIPADNVTVASRGEKTTTGEAPATRRSDRRAEIRFVRPAPAP